MAPVKWQFWIDRGGTFTDVVARDPQGRHHTHKVLSEHPGRRIGAVEQAIRDLMKLAPEQAIPNDQIAVVKMGTTVATNALLERRGSPTVLLITKGFRDLLRIGYQNRPDIFALNIRKPEMLFTKVIEVEERLDAQGQVLVPLDLERLEPELRWAREEGIESCAILLMHGYRYPVHEQQLATLAERIDFPQVSVSHQVSALLKIVSRGDTTVADAYLSPVLRHYVGQVGRALQNIPLMFMQSHGGLTEADYFQGKDSVLSGPAGGIVGAIKTGAQVGLQHIITFDMGGTSTDVAHYRGEYERTVDREVAGTRIRAPMMHIHTVAAGGGSIISFEDHKFRVGPESAGADPGPACYGNGGPVTVTDCNLMLGRLVAEGFPKVFGPNGDQPLQPQVTQRQFEALADRVHLETGQTWTPVDIAQGCLEIAVNNMAQAIKTISVQRGYDLAEYTLCCFGGAGGQLACAVADALAVKSIFIHPFAGVLSAYGIGLAPLISIREQSLELPLVEASWSIIEDHMNRLSQSVTEDLLRQNAENLKTQIRLHIKYAGTDRAFPVPLNTLEHMAHKFEGTHQERFGFTMPEKKLYVSSIEVEGSGMTSGTDHSFEKRPLIHSEPVAPPAAKMTTDMVISGVSRQVPVFQSAELTTGTVIEGPALILSHHSTMVVDPGWRLHFADHYFLERITPPATANQAGSLTESVDPIKLEIFNHLFMSIAEQMGHTLENTSTSVNMRERLDFSCAIFDGKGQLIANAPHMPVHLGSMGASVQALAEARAADFKPGDVYATNNPYSGGTHLPDITVISPIYDDSGRELLFYCASRGHHADIGGMTPGSMPPFSRSIDEEGTLLDHVLLVRDGVFIEDEVSSQFLRGPYPTRNLAQNLTDLRAQIAANAKGSTELKRMVDQFSLITVQAYMNHVQDHAEACVRRVIKVLRPGKFQVDMDGGQRICVAIEPNPATGSARIDFGGTSAQGNHNFNAPEAVCVAAVLYVFRTLVAEPIPMNAGCLRPLDIVIPRPSLLSPVAPAAVVAGNVETSQAVTDCIYGALGVMAAAQGTMNNLTFGNHHHQYYETICGGAGAGATFRGADAIHTHMTNSRITDPEVLELRYPILLESFSIRQDSGGDGRKPGGHGVIRRLRFLEPMEGALLANRRHHAPFGLAGGQPGATGYAQIIRANGQSESLEACDRFAVTDGDAIEIGTPGGGGYGKPAETESQDLDDISFPEHI